MLAKLQTVVFNVHQLTVRSVRSLYCTLYIRCIDYHMMMSDNNCEAI